MIHRPVLFVIASAFAAAWSCSALAAEVCGNVAAASGATIRGPVLQIPSRNEICVALAPDRWVKVALAHPASTRPALMTAAFGKTASCVIGAAGQGECSIEGRPLQGLLQAGAATKAMASLQ
jgi:hypothetical protein